MILICKIDGYSRIYDDGDYWLIKVEGQKDSRIPKSRIRYLPLSAVTKYNMEPVAIEYLKEMGEQFKIEWISKNKNIVT